MVRYHGLNNMKSFKQFFIEKDISGEENPTLYITCKLPSDVHKKWASLVTTTETPDEMEDDPHCTWLWCKLDKLYDEDVIFELLKPLLNDVDISFTPTEYEVFESVTDGTQDCLVVRMDVSPDVKKLNDDTKQILIDNNIEFTQTFPDYKPHMTIGYWPIGSNITWDDPTSDMLKSVTGSIDYMQLSDNGVKSSELNFGEK